MSPTLMENPVQVPSGAVDPVDYRRILGHVPTAVAVVTSAGRPTPAGMTVGSFTSVSLSPPLVTFFVDRGSSTWPRLYARDHFGVNVLAHDQSALCAAFSRRAEDRFTGIAWHESAHGAPLLDDALITMECTRVKVDVIGDHFQVVGRVTKLELRAPEAPLIFLRGGFVDMRLSGSSSRDETRER